MPGQVEKMQRWQLARSQIAAVTDRGEEGRKVIGTALTPEEDAQRGH